MAIRVSSVSMIHAANVAANAKTYPKGHASWAERHCKAWDFGLQTRRGLCGTVVTMIDAWAAYADAHFSRYESSIGEDYVLGVAWVEMGKAIRTMLNGELGGLDGGTVDGMLLSIATNEGASLE